MTGHTQWRLDANLKWLFNELPFEQRFATAAEAGFTGVEVADPYHYSISDLRRFLADSGLELVLINSHTGPAAKITSHGIASDPSSVQKFRSEFLLSVEYATSLHARFIHLLAGRRPPDVSYDRAFATYVMNIAWALDSVSGDDVQIVLEAVNQRDAPKFTLRTLEQAGAIVEASDSDRIGILFDVYHCQVGQGDITQRLRTLLPLVKHIQIADAPMRSEPGSGEINWSFLFRELTELGYAGWVGCEYRPTGATEDSLGWREMIDGNV